MASVKTKFRTLCVLVLVFLCSVEADEQYEIPQPKFQLLKPKGFQVSIPDEPGMKLFAFHGNLNKKMEKMGNGQFAMDIIEKMNGRWIYQNRKLKLRAGDVIYFWVFVIKNVSGYTREDGIYQVTESDVNRISKKIHKLKKRSARRFSDSFDFGPHYYGSDADRYQYGGRRHFGRGYHYTLHTPEYHSLYPNFGSSEYHNHDHRFYGHGHHGSFHDHPHHSWGHHHDSNCDWSDSSDESTSNHEETNTALVTEVVSSSGETTSTPIKTTELISPEPEAELIVTTTSEPQIDLRFGAKTKN
ncbi:uncharacterized protein [Atheta coriaria]|uniref:uncharacterized protein n=1 Tax=Dalotia coriaria TaxID=877792 RepID=UPI0031F4318B